MGTYHALREEAKAMEPVVMEDNGSELDKKREVTMCVGCAYLRMRLCECDGVMV